MRKLVIAEKPSVGREIAKTLGCRDRQQGYTMGDRYIVTWALGHLVELADPVAYSERYKRWSLKDLPMLPETLEQTVIEDTKDQYDVIETLLRRPDIEGVIIATDAGREGELVARWILKMAGWEGNTERLWISSQTEKAILDGFANLRPASAYDDLYAAAECRSAADWYVGLNVTRALTCYYDAKLSAGRVQTPTLALMTKREDEIDEFLGSFYYSARADFGLFNASYYPEENSVRFRDEKLAEEFREWKEKKGTVKSLVSEEKSEPVPQAYDLTELQRDANIMLGFTAKETLDTLQRLYEVHKIVTYPRTDSRYISEDIVPTLGDRIKALQNTVFGRVADEYLASGWRGDNPRLVNDALVSDHHAIIPTEQKVDVTKLTSEENRLWQLIAMRFLEVIGEDYRYKTTTCVIDVDGKDFKTRLTLPQRKGYRSVAEASGMRSAAVIEDTENSFALMRLHEGDEVTLESIRVRKSATTPPERYTDATILGAMEHAGRYVEDRDLKGNLTNGLGTPATRADILDKLVHNRYVERDGKYFVPTAKGREVVRLAPEVLRSPELTGVWEGRLENIAKGKEDPKLFIEDIKKMSAKLVSEVESSTLQFAPKNEGGKTCPYCGGPMLRAEDIDGSTHYICQKLSCQYEEREVKTRVSTGTTAKKVVQTTVGGKPRIVIKKSGAAVPKAVYETHIEVVKESKKKFRAERRDFDRGPRPIRETQSSVRQSDFSGGTMADFFKLSEKKHEERNSRNKKKR